jgi:hypothetical protein
MKLELKVLLIAIVVTFVAMALFYVGNSLTKPNCLPGLKAKLVPRPTYQRGWHCVMSQTLTWVIQLSSAEAPPKRGGLF